MSMMGSLTAADLIRMVELDGWRQCGQTGSHRHFTHGEKPGRVTVADHGGNKAVPTGTMRSVFEQAGIKNVLADLQQGTPLRKIMKEMRLSA